MQLIPRTQQMANNLQWATRVNEGSTEHPGGHPARQLCKQWYWPRWTRAACPCRPLSPVLAVEAEEGCERPPRQSAWRRTSGGLLGAEECKGTCKYGGSGGKEAIGGVAVVGSDGMVEQGRARKAEHDWDKQAAQPLCKHSVFICAVRDDKVHMRFLAPGAVGVVWQVARELRVLGREVRWGREPMCPSSEALAPASARM